MHSIISLVRGFFHACAAVLSSLAFVWMIIYLCFLSLSWIVARIFFMVPSLRFQGELPVTEEFLANWTIKAFRFLAVSLAFTPLSLAFCVSAIIATFGECLTSRRSLRDPLATFSRELSKLVRISSSEAYEAGRVKRWAYLLGYPLKPIV